MFITVNTVMYGSVMAWSPKKKQNRQTAFEFRGCRYYSSGILDWHFNAKFKKVGSVCCQKIPFFLFSFFFFKFFYIQIYLDENCILFFSKTFSWKKKTEQVEFRTWTRLFAPHFAPMSLRKTGIHLSPQEFLINQTGKTNNFLEGTLTSKPDECVSKHLWHWLTILMLSAHPKSIAGSAQIFATINKSLL